MGQRAYSEMLGYVLKEFNSATQATWSWSPEGSSVEAGGQTCLLKGTLAVRQEASISVFKSMCSCNGRDLLQLPRG